MNALKRLIFAASAAFLLAFGGAPAAMASEAKAVVASQTYTYELTKHYGQDTYIRSSTPGQSFGSETLVWIGGWGDKFVGKLKFSTWGLPKVCGADKVKLKVRSAPSVSPGRTPVNMVLYASTQDFDQATDTWNNGYAVDASTAINVPAPAYGSWVLIDITSIYKSWQSGALTNYGLVFDPVETNNNFTFLSSLEGKAAEAPKLVVTKTGPCL